MAGAGQWWRGAVIYQIYIRSFCDSNGDGQGDLAGVLSKLSYLADLGVDAIWLSPIHPSPNRDWGYDVSDYAGVHPDFGNEEDLVRLVGAAHACGLKVMLDEVLAHTSDEHPWFAESLGNGAKADWYVWATAQADGTAPNNWLSAFGGPAWSYQPARRQYYHHKFLRQQPKLNWRNPDARAAALAVLRHWLERGIDGFRLDVANAYLHDAALCDNPPVSEGERTAAEWAHAPNMQLHIHDSNLPENIQVLDEIRRVVDDYPDRFVMGEFSEQPERSGCYAASDEGLHSGYSFPLLEARTLGPDFLRAHLDTLARHPRHWPSLSFSNHDVMRAPSRFGGRTPPPGLARLLLALLLGLRGTVLLYQGEELGLPQAPLPRSALRDPVGDLYYPYTYGRDGCRTPMPWDAAAPSLGFSAGVPWLPAWSGHAAFAVRQQQDDPGSNLNYCRRLIAARKQNPALSHGDIVLWDAGSGVFAFSRSTAGQTVLCLYNLTATAQIFSDPRLDGAHSLPFGCGTVRRSARQVELGPYAVEFLDVGVAARVT
ncbi:MAG: DUF3459 domain-containing protein [Alphaproteobacteria bacterium]|nr:DUF3459 domain-containing protein [Alphaproteobacteria bacterium]